MLLSTYILHIVDKMADTTTVNNKIKNIISKTSIFRQFLYDLMTVMFVTLYGTPVRLMCVGLALG